MTHIPKYRLDADGFKKAILILQLTRSEPLSEAQLRVQTQIGNVDHFIKILVKMNYLKVVEKKSKRDQKRPYDKYIAAFQFQKIAEK